MTNYLTLREYFGALVSNPDSGLTETETDDILDTIAELSLTVEQLCSRRFDERIETRQYLPRPLGHNLGGDVDGRDLVLDDDLYTPSAVYDGVDARTLDSSEYYLSPLGGPPYTIVRLVNPTQRWGLNYSGDEVFHTVTGVWSPTGVIWKYLTTCGAANDTTTTLSLGDNTVVEQGMTLKVDSEYMRVESVTNTGVVVTRAVNGSTAASHSNGANVYYFRVNPVVRRLMKRLASWWNLQTSAPDGVIQVGDIAVTVNTGRVPQDITATINQLKRATRIGRV